MSLASELDALAASLTSAGIRASVGAQEVANVPCALVEYHSADYHYAGDPSTAAHVVNVRVYVARSDLRTGQARLYAFLDPTGSTSVRAALEVDGRRTVRSAGPPSHEDVGGVDYLVVDFDVIIYA